MSRPLARSSGLNQKLALAAHFAHYKKEMEPITQFIGFSKFILTIVRKNKILPKPAWARANENKCININTAVRGGNTIVGKKTRPSKSPGEKTIRSKAYL